MLRHWHQKMQGLSATVRGKLRRGLLHSVSASAHQTLGAQLSLKSRLSDGVKAKTSVDLKSRVVRFEAKKQGSAPENGQAVTSTRLEVVAPMNNKALGPRVIVGLKWQF
jgi:hypothetical protein